MLKITTIARIPFIADQNRFALSSIRRRFVNSGLKLAMVQMRDLEIIKFRRPPCHIQNLNQTALLTVWSQWR